MVKYKLQIAVAALSIIFLTLFTTHPIYAQENNLSLSKLHPASPFYFIKGFKEDLELKLTESSQEKGLKYLEFASRRIKETQVLIDVNRADLIPPALEKYWLSLGKVSSLVSISDEIFGGNLIDEIGMHIRALDQMQAQTDNHKARIAIRAAMYRISIWNKDFLKGLDENRRSSLLSKVTANQLIICNFLTKEASNSALNQTEKATISERAQKCQIKR